MILAIWIVGGTAPITIEQGSIFTLSWAIILLLTGLTLSMTVNALVTGLIVFRIFKVFQEVKTCTADDKVLGVIGGSKLRRVMFILIESGAALFSIQLARLVVTIVNNDNDTDASIDAYYLIRGIHQMLNVIIRSVIAMLFY